MATPRFPFAMLAACMFTAMVSMAADLPGSGPDNGKTVVYRDTWGVAHIYAPTVEAGMYAMGWAQAEDRPEQLLKNLAAALGESALIEGPGAVQSDMLAKLLDHYGMCQRHADKVDPEVRSHVQAFARGITDWYKAHPEDVPAWWKYDAVDEFMIGAFGRLFLYNWSIDDGISDLKRAGIEPGFDETSRGSNQWAVSPQRSANGKAILYIDPHLSWFGPSRFWEFRVHAGEWEGSGFTLAGQPYIGLGHNADLAWAMTTGGPDTADVYELTLSEEHAGRYLYEGEWRAFETREIVIGIKGGGEKAMTLYYSHHGPIIAMRGGKAYALKTSYYEVVNGNEAWKHLNMAKDYTGAVAAMDTLTVFPQNVMCADTAGNIYYQRTGRIPKRPQGIDWSRPVDGSTAATEWLGLHPASDHVQALNPPQGWMQNCNIPPDVMMIDSPMRPEKYPDYLFGDIGYGPRGGWINERGARAVEILKADESVTVDEALRYALDIRPFGVERWIELLRQSHEAAGAAHAHDPVYTAALAELLTWDLELRETSDAALKYYYWRKQINESMGEQAAALRKGVDQHHAELFGSREPFEITAAMQRAMVDAFAEGMAALVRDWGRLDTAYGELFRVGRDGNSWPVGGGGDGEITGRTLRSMSYGKAGADGRRMGRGGQTSTQIVVLSKPIQSWTQPPLGQSDREASEHFDDQAEKLFSTRRMKPTWWQPADLAEHIASRTELSLPF